MEAQDILVLALRDTFCPALLLSKYGEESLEEVKNSDNQDFLLQFCKEQLRAGSSVSQIKQRDAYSLLIGLNPAQQLLSLSLFLLSLFFFLQDKGW